MINLVKTFTGFDDFAAMREAEKFLELAGFSVGSGQRGAPRGILFGDYSIAKWRNLTAQEKSDCHGQMTGDMREGPIAVTIFGYAPLAAKREFHKIAVMQSA